MSESPASTDDLDERVMVYVERISALQKTIQELNGELNRLRQDARINGLDLEALNLVTSLRSRFPQDGGAGIVDNIIHYADLTGVDFERNPAHLLDRVARPSEEPAAPVPSDISSGYMIEEDEQESSFLGPLVLGVSLTALLLWLVH